MSGQKVIRKEKAGEYNQRNYKGKFGRIRVAGDGKEKDGNDEIKEVVVDHC
jgi:hypothetical protein